MFVVKYPNYNMIMMPAYSGIMLRRDKKEEYQFSKGQVLTFNDTEPFGRHYLYIVAVDNHNCVYHDVGTKHKVGLENIFITHRWSIRVFVSLISCIEVNSFLCLKYFLNKDKEFGFLDYDYLIALYTMSS